MKIMGLIFDCGCAAVKEQSYVSIKKSNEAKKAKSAVKSKEKSNEAIKKSNVVIKSGCAAVKEQSNVAIKKSNDAKKAKSAVKRKEKSNEAKAKSSAKRKEKVKSSAVNVINTVTVLEINGAGRVKTLQMDCKIRGHIVKTK